TFGRALGLPAIPPWRRVRRPVGCRTMGWTGGKSRRVRWPAVIVAASVAGASMTPAHAARVTPRAAAGTGLYRGLGSWVDIYEHSSFNNPERAVARMARNGVRTLYLETSNYKRDVAIKWPGKQARFIQAAHASGMKIVAWYLPGFMSARRDFTR